MADKKDVKKAEPYTVRPRGPVPAGSGTAYNRSMQGQAKSQRKLRNTAAVAVVPAIGVSAATIVGLGASGVGPLLAENPVVAGMAAAPLIAGVVAHKAHNLNKSMQARGRVVDAVIASGRGGSPALATRGVGAERTKPYVTKSGANYKNGRVINRGGK